MKKENLYVIGIVVCLALIVGAIAFYFDFIKIGKIEPTPECPTGQIKCSDGTCKASCEVVVDKLATNLVFNAPLKTDAIEKVSGKAGTVSNVVFVDGYAKFNGNSYVKYPYSSNLINTESVSLSACVRLDDPTKHSYFISKYMSWTIQNYAFANATKQFHRFDGLIYKNTSQWSSAGKFSAVAGTWYHIVMTYDGTTENLYVNKVLDSKSTFSYPIMNNPTYGIMIGNREDNLQRGLVGAVKNARIYSKPMTTEQIGLAYDECFN